MTYRPPFTPRPGDSLNTCSPNFRTHAAPCRGPGCDHTITTYRPVSPRNAWPERTLCAGCLAEAFRKPEARR